MHLSARSSIWTPSRLAAIPAAMLLTSATAAQTSIYALRGAQAAERFGNTLAELDDIDGDGVQDFVVTSEVRAVTDASGVIRLGALTAVSGRTGTVIWDVEGFSTFALFGQGLITVSDLDQDGVRDVVTTLSGSVFTPIDNELLVMSGATGAELFRVPQLAPAALYHDDMVNVGDIDGDGSDDVLLESVQGSGPGRARIISLTTSSVLAVFQGQTDGEQFGRAVVATDDLDGDGRGDFAISASRRDGNAGASVGVITTYSSATLIPISSFEGTREFGRFGLEMTAFDDLDGDGIGEIAVRALLGGDPIFAPSEIQFVSPASGAVLFRISDGSPQADGFGASVTALGDYDRDGVTDIAIGSPGTSGAATGGGHVSIYSGATRYELGRYDSPFGGSALGSQLIAPGDLNGDGLPDLIAAGEGDGASHGRVIALATPAAPIYTYCNNTLPNSTGEVGRMAGFGSTSIAANAFLLEASQLPLQSFGFFLVSETPNSIPATGSLQVCVGGAIGRFSRSGEIGFSGSTGQIALAVDLSDLPSPTGSVSAQPFQTLYFQAWFRDTAPPFGSNLTDALGAVILP